MTNTRPAETPESRGPLLRPVVLVGLMGAGKTSVGIRLADALGVGFIDSDHEIESAANMKIPEIFEKYGEPHFRDGERKVIGRLIAETPRIIATGGGAFMNSQTRAVIAAHAISVWLSADLDVLVSRTAGRTHRPLLSKGDPRQILSDLIRERYPVYATADLEVQSLAGQPHEAMVSRIIESLARDGRALKGQSA